MTCTTKEKKGGTLRVTIGKKDFEDWFPNDVPQSLVKYWIDLGRSREKYQEFAENIENRLDLIEAKIKDLTDLCDRQSHLLIQVAKLLTVSSIPNQYQMELLKFNETNGNLSHDNQNLVNLLKIKEGNFKSYIDRIFPGNVADVLLRTSSDKEGSDA